MTYAENARLKAEAESQRPHEHLSATLDLSIWEGTVDLVGLGISVLLDAVVDIG